MAGSACSVDDAAVGPGSASVPAACPGAPARNIAHASSTSRLHRLIPHALVNFYWTGCAEAGRLLQGSHSTDVAGAC